MKIKHCARCNGRGFTFAEDGEPVVTEDGPPAERHDHLLRAAMTVVRHWERHGAFGFDHALEYLKRASERRTREINGTDDSGRAQAGG